MEKIELEAQLRKELGKKVNKIRKGGFIPAVVYGKKLEGLPIAILSKTFKKVISTEAGLNALITLKIAEDKKSKTFAVITHAIQRNPLTDEIIHIDFRQIIMTEEIKTKVPVELIGEPVGLKEGGVLIAGLREIEVKCLPADIPDKFEIDVSALKINESRHVSDLAKIAKVEILTPPTEMIANVSPPTKEEVEAPPPPTPEEIAAAEAAPKVEEEAVKEKGAPGAPPPKAAPAGKQ